MTAISLPCPAGRTAYPSASRQGHGERSGSGGHFSLTAARICDCMDPDASRTHTALENLIVLTSPGSLRLASPGEAGRSYLRCAMERTSISLDRADMERLREWGRRHCPCASFSMLARWIIIQRLDSDMQQIGSEPLPVCSTVQHGAARVVSDPDPKIQTEEEKKDLDPNTVCSTVQHGAASRKRKPRQTSLVEDEATQVTMAFLAKVNEVGGHRYELDPSKQTFQTWASVIRWHMQAEGRTLRDFLSVAESTWKQWKGTIREKNHNPSTLLRKGKFGEYLAEVGQDTAQVPMFGRKLSAEEENAAAWERAANDPDYGKGWGR